MHPSIHMGIENNLDIVHFIILYMDKLGITF